VMRMEDLDAERSKDIYANAALEDLHWLGLRWRRVRTRAAPCRTSKAGGAIPILSPGACCSSAAFFFPCRCTRKDPRKRVGVLRRMQLCTRGPVPKAAASGAAGCRAALARRLPARAVARAATSGP
jgi:glutamyl-tRNA synthetase